MDIDNMLNKMLGKKAKKVQFDNRATWNKPAVNIPITGNFWQAQSNTPYAPTQIQNKIMPVQRTNARPAPIRNQNMWANKPTQNKIVDRIIMKDADRDSVPNKYDCQPNNPERDKENYDKKGKYYGKNIRYRNHDKGIYSQTDKNPGVWFVEDSYETKGDADDNQQDIDDDGIEEIKKGPNKGKYLRTRISKVMRNNEEKGEYIIIIQTLKKPELLE
jgi:hypothetical protein